MITTSKMPSRNTNPTYLHHCFVYSQAPRHDAPDMRKPKSGTTAAMISR